MGCLSRWTEGDNVQEGSSRVPWAETRAARKVVDRMRERCILARVVV